MPVKDRRGAYPSDLSDAQWENIRFLIPKARRGGRKRTTSEREVVNGVFYVVTTGTQWRYLPKDFPPWKTVYHYFRSWAISGAWRSIHDTLTRRTRRAMGRDDLPTYAIVDSQSVRAPSGEERGFDGYKQVRGRKRQILVDTQGLLHGLYIHSASLSDTKEGAKVFDTVAEDLKESLKVVNADMGYRGSFEEQCNLRLNFYPSITLRKNTGQGKKKTAAEKRNKNKIRPAHRPPKRWIVERTFAWFNGYRRLSRDYEKTTRSSAAIIYLAMTQLMLRRTHAAKS